MLDVADGAVPNSAADVNERVATLIADIYEHRRQSEGEPELMLRAAWALAEAEKHWQTHREALQRAEIELVRERTYVEYWQAKYFEARVNLQAIAWGARDQPLTGARE